MAKHETPMLDQLESGPWPSFVSDLKQEAANRAKNENKVEYQIPQDVVEDLLGVMELSYKHGRTHWKHGGIVGVFGYGHRDGVGGTATHIQNRLSSRLLLSAIGRLCSKNGHFI